MQVAQSHKLADVCYDIRGPVLQEAQRLEEEGHRVLKLNIGNPAPFGFDAPEDILRDVILNLPVSQGYSDSKGLLSARRAVVQYAELKQLPDIHVEDIFIGNGVSELIQMALQALLNDGDEVLVPAPGLPAVDREPCRCPADRRALPVRRDGRLAARPRGHGGQDHRPHPGDRGHQSRTTRPAPSIRTPCSSRSSSSPGGTTSC